MSFLTLAAQRYSVRAYKPDAIEPDKLARVLEAVRLAPTACNRQAFGLVVVHCEGRETELKQIYNKPWFAEAPLMIAACGVIADTWVRRDGRSYLDVDVAIVMDHLVLAAAEEGLGTCWVANFDAAAARRILALPDGVEPVVLTPLGYVRDQAPAKRRKGITELVHHEKW